MKTVDEILDEYHQVRLASRPQRRYEATYLPDPVRKLPPERHIVPDRLTGPMPENATTEERFAKLQSMIGKVDHAPKPKYSNVLLTCSTKNYMRNY